MERAIVIEGRQVAPGPNCRSPTVTCIAYGRASDQAAALPLTSSIMGTCIIVAAAFCFSLGAVAVGRMKSW